MANAPKPGRSKISESANLTERLPGPVELSPFKCTDFVLAELLFNLQGRQSLLDRTAGVKTAILAVTAVCKLVRTCKPTDSGTGSVRMCGRKSESSNQKASLLGMREDGSRNKLDGFCRMGTRQPPWSQLSGEAIGSSPCSRAAILRVVLVRSV